MSDKVKIPQKVADAIEDAWNLQDSKHRVKKHLYLTNWALLKHEVGLSLYDILQEFASQFPIEYMKGLVEGYEIEDDQYIVNLWLTDGSYISKATIYDVENTDTPVTNMDTLDSVLSKRPWGNEVRQFGAKNKYIKSVLTPCDLQKYTLVKI